MVRGVSGNFHQGCQKYAPYNGMQCTAIALVAILLLFQGGNVNIFDVRPYNIDYTLSEGTRLYAQIVHSLNDIRYLSHNDLPDSVNVLNQQFSIAYTRDTYYGHVNGNNNGHFGQSPLHESILQACVLSPLTRK